MITVLKVTTGLSIIYSVGDFAVIFVSYNSAIQAVELFGKCVLPTMLPFALKLFGDLKSPIIPARL